MSAPPWVSFCLRFLPVKHEFFPPTVTKCLPIGHHLIVGVFSLVLQGLHLTVILLYINKNEISWIDDWMKDIHSLSSKVTNRKTSTLSSLKAEVLAYGDLKLYLKHNSSTLSERNEMGNIKKSQVFPSVVLNCSWWPIYSVNKPNIVCHHVSTSRNITKSRGRTKLSQCCAHQSCSKAS